jgi:hypothetical protein
MHNGWIDALGASTVAGTLLRRNNIPFTPLPANDVEAVTSNIEASASAGSRSSPLGHVGPFIILTAIIIHD